MGRDPRFVSSRTHRNEFQSTRPRGARRLVCIDADRYMPFQSTRPRGARRRQRAGDNAHRVSFNPRARVGRDYGLDQVLPDYGRFNPRARVGRDTQAPGLVHRNVRFQSTRPRGARRHPKGNRRINVHVSIHAPAWGATH